MKIKPAFIYCTFICCIAAACFAAAQTSAESTLVASQQTNLDPSNTTKIREFALNLENELQANNEAKEKLDTAALAERIGLATRHRTTVTRCVQKNQSCARFKNGRSQRYRE